MVQLNESQKAVSRRLPWRSRVSEYDSKFKKKKRKKECGNLGVGEEPLGTISGFTSHGRKMLWALGPVSQNAWGHGCQTLSAVEKLPQKSVTNKERKRKELCLPVNEAKNGKRV